MEKTPVYDLTDTNFGAVGRYQPVGCEGEVLALVKVDPGLGLRRLHVIDLKMLSYHELERRGWLDLIKEA